MRADVESRRPSWRLLEPVLELDAVGRGRDEARVGDDLPNGPRTRGRHKQGARPAVVAQRIGHVVDEGDDVVGLVRARPDGPQVDVGIGSCKNAPR